MGFPDSKLSEACAAGRHFGQQFEIVGKLETILDSVTSIDLADSRVAFADGWPAEE
jgi:hypothetical protein